MGKTKGCVKTGGRKKGKSNKVTGEVRQWLSELIDKNRAQVEVDLKRLHPKDRLQMLEKLMGYVVPKMQSVEAKVDLNSLTDEQLDNVIQELKNNIEND